MYSNISVTELKETNTKALEYLVSIINSMKNIKRESFILSELLVSDNNDLMTNWNNTSLNMKRTIDNTEETYVSIKKILDAYFEKTMENEQTAQAELEQIDENINALSTEAISLLDGLTSLKGIGLKTEAVNDTGLAGWNNNTNIEVLDESVIDDNIINEKKS